MMNQIIKLYLLALIFTASEINAKSPLEAMILNDPVDPKNVETKIIPPPADDVSTLAAPARAQLATNTMETGDYRVFVPRQFPGYRLKALEDKKTIRFDIAGQSVDVKVPILIYMPESGGILAKSSEITERLSQQLIRTIAKNSGDIPPETKVELSEIAVAIQALSDQLASATPKALSSAK